MVSRNVISANLEHYIFKIFRGACPWTPLEGLKNYWGTHILGHIRNVRPEWVSFPGQKPVDWCKFLTKNLRMGHNFDIILPGNGWFSSKLNKNYGSLVNFCCK